jgi:hypothetical protein
MAGMGYEGSERGATRTGTYHHHLAFGHAFPSFLSPAARHPADARIDTADLACAGAIMGDKASLW